MVLLSVSFVEVGFMIWGVAFFLCGVWRFLVG